MIHLHRPLPRPAPGFWTALLCFALAFVYLAAFVLTAEGQTGWTPPAGAATCWEQEQTRTCVAWMVNPQTGSCRGVINLSVPFALGPDGSGADAYEGRYGIPASAIRDPQGSLVRHCGPWDHTSKPQMDALRHEFWLRTGRAFVGQPTPQELADVRYTNGGGLYALLPRVTGACESEGLSVTCRIDSAFPPEMACQTTAWQDGIWRNVPMGQPVELRMGTHDVFVTCEAGSGVGASWATKVTVPAAAPPPGPVPAPPPAPVPVPASPPPPPPPCPLTRLDNCSGLKNPFGQPVCAACPCPAETPEREKEYHCTPAVVVEPPPPPEPVPVPPCPPTAFELRCRALGGGDSLCLSMSRYVGACDPECDPKCYIPGIPSTGRLENEIVPGSEP